MKKSLIIAFGVSALMVSGALAYMSADRIPVEFYKGHTHHAGGTQGAPEHSGGLDRNGCHNASVPYHCH